MIIEYDTYCLSGHWLSPIVNGDYSSLDDKEEKQLDDWLNNNPSGFYEVLDGEGEFATDQITGLKANCYRVKLWVNQSSL